MGVVVSKIGNTEIMFDHLSFNLTFSQLNLTSPSFIYAYMISDDSVAR